MVITIDSPIDEKILSDLKKEVGAELAETVTLVV